MNRYRCETCKHFKRILIGDNQVHVSDVCDITNGDLFYPKLQIQWTGCASHSDFQSERDKALEAAVVRLKEHLLWDIPHVIYYGIEHSIEAIEKLKEELRQQAGEP
jgi:hypothetical protein